MLVACQAMKGDLVELLLASGGSPFEPVVSSNQLPPVYIPIKRRLVVWMLAQGSALNLVYLESKQYYKGLFSLSESDSKCTAVYDVFLHFLKNRN